MHTPLDIVMESKHFGKYQGWLTSQNEISLWTDNCKTTRHPGLNCYFSSFFNTFNTSLKYHNTKIILCPSTDRALSFPASQDQHLLKIWNKIIGYIDMN